MLLVGQPAPALDPLVREYLAGHHVRCPGFCGRDLYRIDAPQCPTCRRDLRSIVVPAEDPGAATLPELFERSELHCPGCEYSLRGLRGELCPECGLHLEFAHFFGPPAEEIPEPPPAMVTARSAAWACVPGLVLHVGIAVPLLADAGPPWRNAAPGLIAGALATLDLAVILALFIGQQRYETLSVDRRQGIASLCWIWSIGFWILACAGLFSR